MFGLHRNQTFFVYNYIANDKEPFDRNYLHVAIANYGPGIFHGIWRTLFVGFADWPLLLWSLVVTVTLEKQKKD